MADNVEGGREGRQIGDKGGGVWELGKLVCTVAAPEYTVTDRRSTFLSFKKPLKRLGRPLWGSTFCMILPKACFNLCAKGKNAPGTFKASRCIKAHGKHILFSFY